MALAMWKTEWIWTNLDRNTSLDINLHSLHSLHNIPHKGLSSGPWSAPGPLGPWAILGPWLGSTSCSPRPLRLAIPPWQRAKDPTWVDSVDCRQLSAALSSARHENQVSKTSSSCLSSTSYKMSRDVTRCHKMSALERLATDSAKLWKILKCGCCCSWFCWKMSKVFLKLCQHMPKAGLAQLLASGFKSLQLLRRFFSAQSSCCQNLHFPRSFMNKSTLTSHLSSSAFHASIFTIFHLLYDSAARSARSARRKRLALTSGSLIGLPSCPHE